MRPAEAIAVLRSTTSMRACRCSSSNSEKTLRMVSSTPCKLFERPPVPFERPMPADGHSRRDNDPTGKSVTIIRSGVKS